MDRFSFHRLVDNIVEACRQKAAKLEGFASGDGCIRITYLPQCSLASEMPGLMTRFTDRYEATARITPQGNYVINRDRREGSPVDTYSFSALKVAACLKAIELGLSERSGHDLGDLACDEEHGFASYRGAICYNLLFSHQAFALLIICASGATAIEDEEVAEAAGSAILDWCIENPQFSVEVPAAILPR